LPSKLMAATQKQQETELDAAQLLAAPGER